MRCTLYLVHELTRETEEIDCDKCDSYTRCCRNLRPPIQWVSQKFCNHSYTGCIRNYAAIYTLGVVEILRPFIQWMWQKFCNDSYTGCCRNSATTHTLDVAEILRPHSYTGCRRNSAIIHDHIQGVADILRPIIHWVLQKFCNHSDTESG